jgi:hypothetical protein
VKIQKQNPKTLQLYSEIIKAGSIRKSNKNAKLEGFGSETKWSN